MQTNEATPDTADQEEPVAPLPPSGKKQRLSTPQMLHLMRLEVDRAVEHGYPISCMMFGLDGFWGDDELLLRKQVMPRLFHELKTVTFESKVRGLGIWTEAFELAVFPHVTPEKIQELAESLLERARAIELTDTEIESAVTISIGISHNLRRGRSSFEQLVEEAESGSSLAQSAGGDRVSAWKEVESEVDDLRVELEEQLREIEEVQEKLFGDKADQQELWGKSLVSKVIRLFEAEPDQSAGVIRLQFEVIKLLKEELANLRETSSVSQLIESQRQIENMERRINKLTESLGVTETELKRVAAMKNIDVGVSSIYRTVQGLTGDDDSILAKKEMLKNIFEANVALRDALAKKT